MSGEPPWAQHFGVDPEDRRTRVLAAAGEAIGYLACPAHQSRTPLTPDALARTLGDLEICPTAGAPLDHVLGSMTEDIWAHQTDVSHQRTAAHLHAPTLIPAVVAELAIGASNQSMDSWDQAPAATHTELSLLSWLGRELGLGARSTGVMTSGGTSSNLLGLTLARAAMAGREGVDVSAVGLPPSARRWRILASDGAHFSVARAASLLGLGRDRVVAVPTDETGAMDITALDSVLQALAAGGLQPMAIVATAGTTDLGAIDPLTEISARARRAGCWFHVDAAVGGALVLSDRHRVLLAGIDSADSVTVDFHKLWWQPISASALVVAEPSVFDLLRVPSAYLDRGDEPDGMINLVGRSLDTSRRFDAAKVVASLKTVGRTVYGLMLDHIMELAAAAGDEVRRTPGLHLVAPVSTVMCAFRAVGRETNDLQAVQHRLLVDGTAVIGRSTIGGLPVLKLTFVNPMTTVSQARDLVRFVADALAPER